PSPLPSCFSHPPHPPVHYCLSHTTLFRSVQEVVENLGLGLVDLLHFRQTADGLEVLEDLTADIHGPAVGGIVHGIGVGMGLVARSEEHTSELQSRFELVCRRLLEKKKRCR